MTVASADGGTRTGPFDREAELTVAASCLLSPMAWWSVRDVMTPADVFLWKPRKIIEAAAGDDLDGLVGGTPRLDMFVRETGFYRGHLEQFRDEWVLFMTGGRPWCLRVADAARCRRAMNALADAYERIGAGVPLESVVPLLQVVGS